MHKRSFLVLVSTLAALAGLTSKAQAVPEMARFGYFSCNTCHVAPTGTGPLTPYGRSLAAERLSTWAYKDEEQALHGLGPKLPEWLIVGGDVRYAQVHTETAQNRTDRRIRMQTDLALGVVLPRLAIVGAGGPHGETRSNPDLDGAWTWRQYFAKVDVTETLFVRGGRFFPRYGLGMPQHNLNIRSGLGFDQGQENGAIEAMWATESNELTVTRMTGKPRTDPEGSREQGWVLSYAYSLFGKHRVGASALTGRTGQDERLVYGVSGVFALSDQWFLMSEVDKQTRKPEQGNPSDALFVYNRLGYEPVQGVVPFLSSEVSVSDVRSGASRADTWALGAQWYPRPHFDFEGQVGATLLHANYSFIATAYLIAHYYL